MFNGDRAGCDSFFLRIVADRSFCREGGFTEFNGVIDLSSRESSCGG